MLTAYMPIINTARAQDLSDLQATRAASAAMRSIARGETRDRWAHLVPRAFQARDEQQPIFYFYTTRSLE